MDLTELAEQGVKRALATGADAAEVYATRSRGVRVAAAGPYASPSVRADAGVGVRVLVAGRLGQAGALAHDALDATVAEALAAARRAGAPVHGGFGAARPARHDRPCVRSLADDDAEEALDVVQRCIGAATRREGVGYAQAELRRFARELAVVNSSGLSVTDRYASASLELELRVSRATAHRTTRDAFVDEEHAFGGFDVETWLDERVPRALDALAPQPLPGAVSQVILGPSASSQILRLVANGFSGAAIAAGRSPLALGQQAFSERVSVRDDPRGRRLYDDEGTPTRLLPLVDAGVVRALHHDVASARAAGVEPSGSGFRKGVMAGIAPRPLRLSLAEGDASLAELVEQAERAVLVTEPLTGAFVSDKVTADFSVVAPFAFYVEAGRIRHALPPTTIGGNAHDVFRSVVAVGRDARPCAAASTPSLLAGGVTCAT